MWWELPFLVQNTDCESSQISAKSKREDKRGSAENACPPSLARAQPRFSRSAKLETTSIVRNKNKFNCFPLCFRWALLYFVAWYLISVILVINLFVALILEVKQSSEIVLFFSFPLILKIKLAPQRLE